MVAIIEQFLLLVSFLVVGWSRDKHFSDCDLRSKVPQCDLTLQNFPGKTK